MKTLLHVGMLNSVAFGACGLALLASDASGATDASKKTVWFQMTPDIAKIFDIDSTELSSYPGVLPTLTELSFDPAGFVVSKEDFLAMTKADAGSTEVFSNAIDAKTVVHAIGIKEAIELELIDGNGLPNDAIVLLALGDLSPSIRQMITQPLSKVHLADVAAYFGEILSDQAKNDAIAHPESATDSKQNGLDHQATT